MLKQIYCVFSVIAAVSATGSLIILNHPKSISFKGDERLDESVLKELYSAALGFTIEQSSNWPGMYLNDPFHLAKAIVTVYVDGINDIGLNADIHYPLYTNEDEEDIWNALEKRVLDRYPNSNAKLVRIQLNEGVEAAKTHEIFKNVKDESNIKTSYLTTEDQPYLNEIGLLNNIVTEINKDAIKPQNARDVFWFVLTRLHDLSDLHGENSSQTIEAKKILANTLMTLQERFTQAYNGDVLVTVVTSDASHTRIARSVSDEKKVGDMPTNLNLAPIYSSDYPVIFNIILWFVVAMFFSLLAISIVIGGMDPGRDSIIYRMTSNRMKKDN